MQFGNRRNIHCRLLLKSVYIYNLFTPHSVCFPITTITSLSFAAIESWPRPNSLLTVKGLCLASVAMIVLQNIPPLVTRGWLAEWEPRWLLIYHSYLVQTLNTTYMLVQPTPNRLLLTNNMARKSVWYDDNQTIIENHWPQLIEKLLCNWSLSILLFQIFIIFCIPFIDYFIIYNFSFFYFGTFKFIPNNWELSLLS